MSTAPRKTVLISEPQLMEMGLPYLPVMWGILKTYWEHHGSARDAFEWLHPLHQVGKVSSVLRPYAGTQVDVLGLSCYTWNWQLQTQVAQHFKARNPNCLVVAGGPEPDYKDPDFFKKYPYIDMIAVKDGEITFNKILDKVLAHPPHELLRDRKSAFADIKGLYLPDPDGDKHLFTGQAEVPTAFTKSPYIEQSAFYEQVRQNLSSNVIAVWETNRGCPYRCSYCDWGSSTMSKLRRFDMERIKAEVDWFGRMKVSFIMLADANFGILPQDPEIADLVVEANKKYGYPNYFSYNTAKNNPNRTVEIAKKFINSGLSSTHVLSIQHTDKDVLAATERANISTDKQVQVVKELMEDGIPIYVQLILGIPGDSYRTWKKCFSDLMEWGIHAHYWVFPYNLLPNAPANEPEYVARWELETVHRYVLLNHGLRLRGHFDPISETKSRLIVKTRTFSREDWVRMHTYSACVKALHNCCATQSIAVYMRFTHGLSYARFYEDVIEGFFMTHAPSQAWYQAVLEHYQGYLQNEDAIDFMEVPQMPSFPYQVDPGHWVFIQLSFHLEEFFKHLTEYLLAKYPEATNLASVIDYQKNIIILPSYDRQRGKAFSTDFDWLAYFEEARRRISFSPMPEPAPTPGAVMIANDQAWSEERMTLPLDWGNGTEQERWAQWVHTTVAGRNSVFKNNFQKLRRHQPELTAAAS